MEGHTHFVSKNLTPEIYDKLKDLKTKSGYTIDKCIQGGIDNPNFSVGECSNFWASLFILLP